ncbi:hypothetical protein HPB47_025259 [Ixodes persulcatus]|uniref:Uncharacterized protein n=1 Tax=Ixodes persulcatus TaxID=34615 RepID=A0AC60Q2D0_IXOPE|nr:hypothetical protein HPB47_025259 [Ixodes persulcatus]
MTGCCAFGCNNRHSVNSDGKKFFKSFSIPSGKHDKARRKDAQLLLLGGLRIGVAAQVEDVFKEAGINAWLFSIDQNMASEMGSAPEINKRYLI